MGTAVRTLHSLYQTHNVIHTHTSLAGFVIWKSGRLHVKSGLTIMGTKAWPSCCIKISCLICAPAYKPAWSVRTDSQAKLFWMGKKANKKNYQFTQTVRCNHWLKCDLLYHSYQHLHLFQSGLQINSFKSSALAASVSLPIHCRVHSEEDWNSPLDEIWERINLFLCSFTFLLGPKHFATNSNRYTPKFYWIMNYILSSCTLDPKGYNCSEVHYYFSYYQSLPFTGSQDFN